MQQWLTRSAAEQGRAIGRGDLDPVELAQAYLEAIAAHEFGDRIYARTTPDRALAEAQAAAFRAKNGVRRGVLDGVPVSWKDLFDSAGVATEAGSLLLAGRVPETDAKVLADATLQGMVCLGKTHMTELAFSGMGLNPCTASPPNSNDPECASGGSSSGAATSVAFGLASAGIGSDTGGSVRIPACWNDLVGLKTTSGLLSVQGVVPLCPSFDTVGPLTRTVEDAGLILAALLGEKAADLKGASLAGRHFALLKTVAMDGVRSGPAQGFDRARRALEAAGAKITEIDAPEITEAFALVPFLYGPEAYATQGELIEPAPEKMFPPVLARFRGGKGVEGIEVIRAWTKLNDIRVRWNARIAGFDAVIHPTAPNLPPRIDRMLEDEAYFTSENLLALRNTRICNLSGGAALTLPTGETSAGITLLGGPLSEGRLLRLGAALEPLLGA